MGIGMGLIAVGVIAGIAFVLTLFTGTIGFRPGSFEFNRQADPRGFWLFMAALFGGGALAALAGCLILAGVVPMPYGGSGLR